MSSSSSAALYRSGVIALLCCGEPLKIDSRRIMNECCVCRPNLSASTQIITTAFVIGEIFRACH